MRSIQVLSQVPSHSHGMLPLDGARAPGRVERGAQRTMRGRLHLKPGQKGTKQLLAPYGDTVELLVAERDWESPRPPYADNQIVGVRIGFAEAAVRELAKQAGGKWNPDRKVWELRHRQAVALKLDTRIVNEHGIQSQMPAADGGASTRRCSVDIYFYMLASGSGCRHLLVDARAAAEF